MVLLLAFASAAALARGGAQCLTVMALIDTSVRGAVSPPLNRRFGLLGIWSLKKLIHEPDTSKMFVLPSKRILLPADLQ